ncbi:hypothetical protein P2318_04420 [Myxococcaceae bacterium GXIMD 01537]
MESRPPLVCPRCGAPRILAPECPQCGVIYARAQPRAVAAPAPIPEPRADLPAEELAPPPLAPHEMFPPDPERPPHLPSETLTWHGAAEDAQWEYRIRLFALPAALLVAWLLMSTRVGSMLVRIVFGMWVHESGHAITAWLCGYRAFPGPWFTPVGEIRSPFLSLLAAGVLAFFAWRAWRAERWPVVAALGVVLGLQFLGTVVLSASSARQLIYFGGDAGNLVLGTLLMASLYAGRDSQIHQGWLRWGFLVIGACAFMDVFTLWRRALDDFGVIPFGANEGSGPSDPSVLADGYHWTVNQLVHRYVNLGWACLAVLAALYAWGLHRARADLREAGGG